ncbi:MAG TPA: hypothetical protein VME40_20415 [Caulobacteraceae bacterium]|nr:hypothetical protein [Caulobacteraceae bacterium]
MRPRPFGLAILGAMLIAIASFANVASAATSPPPPFKPPEITSDARAAGKKAVPALLTAANIPCQMSDARYIGPNTDPKTKKEVKYYEVACTGAMGYVIVDKGAGETPAWASCPELPKTDPATGKVNGAACFLPGNLDDKALLAPYVAASKVPCTVSDVRGIGHTATASFFEVACSNSRGYIVKTSAPPRLDQPVQMITCLAYTDASSPVYCKLSNGAAQLAAVDALAAQSGKNCQVKDRRYMVTAQDMSNYYEVACTDGKGWVLQELPDGKLGQIIGCDAAGGIAGGCTLTNSAVAQTEQIGLYTKLARAAGFACDVSKYSPFGAAPTGYDEAVELACSNRPDGAVMIDSGNGSKPTYIYDCAHSELVGFKCSFTPVDAALPHLTDELKSLGKTSCVVSGEKVLGITQADNTGYIEVACADGNPGYIISFQLPMMKVKEATACSIAKDLAGGCTLPTNVRH